MSEFGTRPSSRSNIITIKAIALAAHRDEQAVFAEQILIFVRAVLDASVTMVDEPIPLERPSIIVRLLQRVEDEPGLH
jgi:hypothetical protein